MAPTTSSALSLAAFACVLAAFPLGAQERPDHAALNRFEDSLAAESSPQAVGAMLERQREGAQASALSLTRLGLAQLRAAELGTGRTLFEDALITFDKAIDRAPAEWAYPWYGLGLAKAGLSARGAIAKAGARQLSGMSYEEGAMDALSRALTIDPTFSQAASALGRLLTQRPERRWPNRALDPLRVSATEADRLAPEVFLVLGRAARQQADAGEALQLFARYQEAGGDRGVALLEQARTLRFAGEVQPALASYWMGVDVAGPAGRELYLSDLAWRDKGKAQRLRERRANAGFVFVYPTTRPRNGGASSMSPTEFAQTVRQYWVREDAARLRAEGRSLEAYLATYVTEETGKPPQFTPAGLELPEPVDAEPYSLSPYALNQRYGLYGLASELCYDLLSPCDDLGSAQAFGRYGLHGIPGPTFSGGYSYLGTGVDGTGGSIGTGAYYPSGAVVVATSLAFADLSGRDRGWIGSPSKARVWALRALDRMSTPQPFRRSLHATAQVLGVGHPAAGNGRALVIYAVPGKHLEWTPLDGGGGYYDLLVRVGALSGSTAAHTDTTIMLRRAEPLEQNEWLTGFVELPLGPGAHNVRIMLSQMGGGGDVLRGARVVLPRAASELALSDLVLGKEGSGLIWRIGDEVVELAGVDGYRVGEALPIYYEASGLIRGESYRTSIELRRGGRVRVSVSFDMTADDTWMQIQRTLRLQDVEPGVYEVVVSLQGGGAKREVIKSRQLKVE